MAIIKIQCYVLNKKTMHRLHNSSDNRKIVKEQSKSRIISKYSWLSFSYLFFIMDTNKDIQHQLDKINERLGIMICNNFHLYLLTIVEIINRTFDFTSEQIEKEIEDQNKLNEVYKLVLSFVFLLVGSSSVFKHVFNFKIDVPLVFRCV